MAKRNVVVIFPDAKGQGVQGSFGGKILNQCPDMRLVPILNGLPPEQLKEIAKNASSSGYFEPIISLGKGLKSALVDGYSYAVNNYPDSFVVRLDTAEHPVEYIQTLLDKADEAGRIMIIGDLDFSGGDHLREGSIDQFAHLDLFPILYGQYSQGKLPISCAHGFQVFSPGVCEKVLLGALEIVTEVEKELGASAEWGFDGAMALSAYNLGVPVSIVKVSAETRRDRDRKKVADQFDRALRMCRAAERVFATQTYSFPVAG